MAEMSSLPIHVFNIEEYRLACKCNLTVTAAFGSTSHSHEYELTSAPADNLPDATDRYSAIAAVQVSGRLGQQSVKHLTSNLCLHRALATPRYAAALQRGSRLGAGITSCLAIYLRPRKLKFDYRALAAISA